MAGFSAKGYLFQRPLAPDPRLVKLTGTNGLVSLRFFVRLEPSGPAVQACVAKLPGKGQVADNFWRRGAVLCGVDTENGAVLHAVSDADGNIEIYPGATTGKKSLIGQKLPGFSKASDLVKRAAPVLAGVRTQSWDVAMTSKGPVLLEVNFGGDLSLIQLGHNKGILTPEYCEHLKRNGYRGRLP